MDRSAPSTWLRLNRLAGYRDLFLASGKSSNVGKVDRGGTTGKSRRFGLADPHVGGSWEPALHLKTHLRKMDELKQSVQLAVHEQKDPLLIYKFEAFELFKSLIDSVNKEILSFYLKLKSQLIVIKMFRRQAQGNL